MRSIALALVLLTASVQAASVTRSLASFKGVQVCVPFNVVVQPGTGYSVVVSLTTFDGELNCHPNLTWQDGGTFAAASPTLQWPAPQIINGDQAVLDAVQTTISSGVLQLTTSSAGFQTSQPIQLGVNVPAAALTGVNLTGSAGVLVSDGFNVPALTLQHQGAGTFRAQGLTAQKLTLLNSGTGSMSAAGTIATAAVTLDGTGSATLSGVTGSVSAQVSGTAVLNVIAANANVAITGAATGLAHVEYNQGQCTVQGSSFFGGVCRQNTAIAAPPRGQSFTCGIAVNGASTCTGSTSSSSGNNQISGSGQFQSINTGNDNISSTSSSSGTGSVSASSTSSNINGQTSGSTTTSNNGQTIGSLNTGSGGAQLTNIQCAVNNAAAQG